MHNRPPRECPYCGNLMLSDPCAWCGGDDSEITRELDTRELVPYDDDCEPTLPDAGAETSHQ